MTREPSWYEAAQAAICAFAEDKTQLSSAPTLLAAADILNDGVEVKISGHGGVADLLLKIARIAADPALCIIQTQEAAYIDGVPETVAAYLCRRRICGPPILDPARLAKTLRTRNLGAI